MKRNDFTTTDLYLASAVSILLQIQPKFKVENNMVLFTFPVSDDLYRAMTAYNSGVSLNAFEFAQTIKKLRGEMYMAREGKHQ